MHMLGVYAQRIRQNMSGFCEDMQTVKPGKYKTRLGCAIKETNAVLFDDLSFPSDTHTAVWRACKYGSFFLFASLILAERGNDGLYTMPNNHIL